MSPHHPRVFVALSGGVDSSVAAALLKERGFDVVGIHMKMWSPRGSYQVPATSYQPDVVCRQQYQDRIDAMAVAARLDIPVQTWDFTEEYRRAVVEYMIQEYAEGRTPNPDVMCNRRIKFGLFLRKAIESGADYVATGHYVRLRRTDENGEIGEADQLDHAQRSTEWGDPPSLLLQALDQNKDQSYFLWTLTQGQLQRCLFPIGEFTKPEVRAMAREFGLPTAEKPDSQGICFIGEIDVREFLVRYIPERRGRVLTAAGKTIGEHGGAEFFTIGQRQGLGIGGGIPYYVAEKNITANTLTVAEGPYDGKLFRRELMATDVNWISGRPPAGGFPLRCEARIRYRQPLQRCTVQIGENGKSAFGLGEIESSSSRAAPPAGRAGIHQAQRFNNLIVVFDVPQRAVTPGQSIVFYQGQELLGGGIIV